MPFRKFLMFPFKTLEMGEINGFLVAKERAKIDFF